MQWLTSSGRSQPTSGSETMKVNDGRYDQAVLTARIDGDRIRLAVQGGDWQIQEIVNSMRALTALPKKTKDNSGELTVPLTWAMVTQLARLMTERGHIWRPDDILVQWIYDEFMRRHDESTDLKFDLSSLSWTPMPHQLAGHTSEHSTSGSSSRIRRARARPLLPC